MIIEQFERFAKRIARIGVSHDVVNEGEARQASRDAELDAITVRLDRHWPILAGARSKG